MHIVEANCFVFTSRAK